MPAVERVHQLARVVVRGMRLDRRLGRGHVDDDDARQLVAGAEGVQVGDDARERGARLRARLAPGDPGALLGLGRLQRAAERRRAARRAARRRRRAAPRAAQRRLHDVVAAEDEVAERRQPGIR